MVELQDLFPRVMGDEDVRLRDETPTPRLDRVQDGDIPLLNNQTSQMDRQQQTNRINLRIGDMGVLQIQPTPELQEKIRNHTTDLKMQLAEMEPEELVNQWESLSAQAQAFSQATTIPSNMADMTFEEIAEQNPEVARTAIRVGRGMMDTVAESLA